MALPARRRSLPPSGTTSKVGPSRRLSTTVYRVGLARAQADAVAVSPSAADGAERHPADPLRGPVRALRVSGVLAAAEDTREGVDDLLVAGNRPASLDQQEAMGLPGGASCGSRRVVSLLRERTGRAC